MSAKLPWVLGTLNRAWLLGLLFRLQNKEVGLNDKHAPATILSFSLRCTERTKRVTRRACAWRVADKAAQGAALIVEPQCAACSPLHSCRLVSCCWACCSGSDRPPRSTPLRLAFDTRGRWGVCTPCWHVPAGGLVDDATQSEPH